MQPKLSPADFILARAAACRAGDFAFVYDSYLDDSNFRRQFPLRHEYLAYAQEVLSGDFVLHECRVLRDEQDGSSARVIFYQRLAYQGAVSETLELAHLSMTESGWRFDCSEKLERDAVVRPLEEVGWDDFNNAPDKVIF